MKCVSPSKKKGLARLPAADEGFLCLVSAFDGKTPLCLISHRPRDRCEKATDERTAKQAERQQALTTTTTMSRREPRDRALLPLGDVRAGDDDLDGAREGVDRRIFAFFFYSLLFGPTGWMPLRRFSQPPVYAGLLALLALFSILIVHQVAEVAAASPCATVSRRENRRSSRHNLHHDDMRNPKPKCKLKNG